MKIIVLLMLFVCGLVADSYIGFDVGKADNSHTFSLNEDALKCDNNYNEYRIKFGSGEDGGVKFQIAFNKIDYQAGIYDQLNNSLYEIGFDLLKEVEITPSAFPFIKTGFSLGKMETDFTTDGNVRELSFSLGAGLSYRVTSKLYILAGVDYIWRKWSEIFVGSGTLETKDHAVKPYIGINYKF